MRSHPAPHFRSAYSQPDRQSSLPMRKATLGRSGTARQREYNAHRDLVVFQVDVHRARRASTAPAGERQAPTVPPHQAGALVPVDEGQHVMSNTSAGSHFHVALPLVPDERAVRDQSGGLLDHILGEEPVAVTA